MFLMSLVAHQPVIEIVSTVVLIVGVLLYLWWRKKRKRVELLRSNMTSFMPINLILFYAISSLVWLEFNGKGWWSFFITISIANGVLITFDLLVQVLKPVLLRKIISTLCILAYWYIFWYFVMSLVRTFKPEKVFLINTVITLILLFEIAIMLTKIWRGGKGVQHNG